MIIWGISLYLFIGIVLLSIMFVNSFMRSKSSYGRILGLLSLTLLIYLLGYLLEINSDSLEDMYFWNQIQYFGIPFFPPLWLLVSMLYTGRGKKVFGVTGIIIFTIPVITFFMHLTNAYHYLYYSKVELQTINHVNLMYLTKGPWYLLQTVYVLFILLLCTWFYFQRYRKSKGDEKIQFSILLVASSLPYLALVLVTLNIGGIGIDYTALVLPPCIFLINLALNKFNFLEIKILAREKVFEDSEKGFLLLNRFYRVVDFNKASIELFNLFDVQMKVDEIENLLKDQADILNCIKNSAEKIFAFSREEEQYYISISVREFQSKEDIVGHLVTIEDITERELLRRQLLNMADTDELSGLYNRRKFHEHARKIVQECVEEHRTFSVLMLDIDFFKTVNDTFGHSVGDEVIRGLSSLLRDTFSKNCITGRMGGEEFAVILLDTAIENAYEQAEKFRIMIEERELIFRSEVKITVSIGVAQWNERSETFDEVLNRADHALYEAKYRGRNCTRMSLME